ncbi:mycothiol conjugate amidase Mca [Agrococcus casei]|uniref:Mycothiol S-conjugate amidase Mca n=2 Tax=Agrococcus TaxID=46352 RepID=A0A1R4EUW1_9MICO|nr:Mycothiol S-conjugate amidase Mca [Agrococcus casei LMG 22410]
MLAVHAHPDDESSKGAATLARYASEGHEVTVVSCTGGEAGDVLNDRIAHIPAVQRDLTGYRRGEMAAARDALGIDHIWLGYHDSGLPGEGEDVAPNSFATIPVSISMQPLVRIIRRLKPHVLVTYDENGGYPHPDHIRTHEISMAAVDAAASAAHPELGEPWQVLKVYYDRGMNGDRMHALFEDYELHDPTSDRLEIMREWRDRRAPNDVRLTTRVDIGGFLEARDAALKSHASQIPDDAWFFFWPHDVVRRAWPTDDYELVMSRVADTVPESELFDGLEAFDDSAESASDALARGESC